MITRAKNNIFKPKKKKNLNLTATTPSSYESIEPTTISQVQKIPHWHQAMSEEFDALICTFTWTLVPINPIQNIIRRKWIFRTKRSPDGSVMRYKAQLVTKGFHQ